MTQSRSIRVDALLEQHGTPFGDRAALHPCEGARHHSPTPLTTQAITIGDTTTHLCPTCAANVAVYVHLARTSPESLTWDVRREFGNIVRDLAKRQIDAWFQGDDHA